MSGDHKEIPRYYNFSYLLQPAPDTDAYKLMSVSTLIGMEHMKKLVIKSAINAFVLSSDVILEKGPPPHISQYTGTEKNIDGAIATLQKLDMTKLTVEIMHGFIQQPTSNYIYGFLLNFEIDMLNRGVKNEPLRVKA